MSVIEPDRRDLDIFDRHQEIPEDEKRDILDQIEKSISASSVPDVAPVKPKKKGFLFLLIVNLSAAVILAVVVLGAVKLFEVRRERLNLEVREVASAEGKILDEFKREAEEKLKEKDAAILRVLKQLGSLERERTQLSRIMELRIQEKEREMRRKLAAELANRRESLQKEGLPAVDIERQLLALETDKKRQIFEELQAFQAEVDSLTRQKEQELLKEKEAARLSLEQATLEREKLLMSTQKEEIELRDRIRPGETGIVGVVSVQDRLSEPEASNVQERLVVDRIVGSYTAIAAKLADKRYEEASAELTALEKLFMDEEISSLPAVQRRRESDLRIIGAFRALIVQATAMGPMEKPGGPQDDENLIEDMQRALSEKEREIARLNALAEQERAEIMDTQKLAVQARDSAYQDVLRTIARFQEAGSAEELRALSRDLGSRDEEPLYDTLLAALQNLAVESLASHPAPGVSYRILGTVTLVGRGSITVLPIANLTLRAGARIEVRRFLDTGEAVRVALGTLTDIKGEKLVARIDSEAAEGGVAVTDKVYLIVE